MNWRGCARKGKWSNLRYYPGICLEGLSQFTKTSARTVVILAEIRTDACQKGYRFLRG
jgi:hypothetical protein